MPKSNPADAFRPPDVTLGDLSIWYGPGEKADEIENVTTVQRAFGWLVGEHTFLGGYEMYEEGESEWRSIYRSVDATSARKAAAQGVAEIANMGGEEDLVTTEDMIYNDFLPPDGLTVKAWKKQLRKKNPAPVSASAQSNSNDSRIETLVADRERVANPQSGPFTSVPSVKKLESELGLDRATAKKLHAVLKGDEDTIDDVLGPSNVLTWQGGRAPARSLAMEAADKLMGNHGIEAQRDDDGDSDDAPDFLYSNTGDSYAPTLLFRGSRVWISSWGDEVERDRRRNPAEPSDARFVAIAARLARGS